MGTTSKLAIGVSIASGVLLAAWLLTGTRKEKTKKFIAKGTATLTRTIKQDRTQVIVDDSDINYV